MRKLHLGSGGAAIEGWENHDMDVDLRKPLPYEDGSVDFIFTEHVVEHLTQREAWSFFEECLRILRRGGVLRTTVPSVVKLGIGLTREYVRFVKENGWGDGTRKSGIKHLVFNHGHQSMWTAELLSSILGAIGFESYEASLHTSCYPELQGVEQHWRAVGKKHSDLESIVVEAVKA